MPNDEEQLVPLSKAIEAAIVTASRISTHHLQLQPWARMLKLHAESWGGPNEADRTETFYITLPDRLRSRVMAHQGTGGFVTLNVEPCDATIVPPYPNERERKAVEIAWSLINSLRPETPGGKKWWAEVGTPEIAFALPWAVLQNANHAADELAKLAAL